MGSSRKTWLGVLAIVAAVVGYEVLVGIPNSSKVVGVIATGAPFLDPTGWPRLPVRYTFADGSTLDVSPKVNATAMANPTAALSFVFGGPGDTNSYTRAQVTAAAA